MKKRGEKLPLNRIKKIMQSNKEVGKIQKATPHLMSLALEYFVEDLCAKSAQLA